MSKAWLKSVISAVFGTWQDQPRCGCGRAERSRWRDPHVRTPAHWTSCVENSPSMKWKMSVARNVICWRRLTGPFPSDTPGCNCSGWCGRGSTAWTLYCSWPAANASESGSAWHGLSDSSWTPVEQLHSGRAVVAAAWTLAVPPTRCYSSPAWTLWAPGPAAVWLTGWSDDDEPSADDECGRSKQQQFWQRVLSSSASSPYRCPDPGRRCWAVCCSDRLMRCSLARLGREPNQIISVLSSFSCSRRNAHHLATSETQLVRRSRTDSASTSELLS